uniref:HAT C-terminal dimerisation domain-containing protein n=1 Tax=Nelumbo nucifera TaxID=4432 RepID=A0A822YLF0_NELNU|nr:TPA_asm: hypothetical protein HUJ06_012188 [Nelumbo nucifera]
MARDLLAMHVSTVAFESAFSTGGRVLDSFHSSLTPRMVEAIICDKIEESLNELENMELGKVCVF